MRMRHQTSYDICEFHSVEGITREDYNFVSRNCQWQHINAILPLAMQVEPYSNGRHKSVCLLSTKKGVFRREVS